MASHNCLDPLRLARSLCLRMLIGTAALLSGVIAATETASAFDGPNVGLLVDSTLPGMQGAGCQAGACTSDTLRPTPFGGSATLPFDFGVASSNGDTYQITGTIGNSVNSDGTIVYQTYIFTVTLTGAADGETSAGQPDRLSLHMFSLAARKTGNWTGYGLLQGNFSAGFNIQSQIAEQSSFTTQGGLRKVSNGPVKPASAITRSTFDKTGSVALPSGGDPILLENVFTIDIQTGTRVGSAIYLSTFGTTPSVQIYSSILPTARTTFSGGTVTAFATIVNATSPDQPAVDGGVAVTRLSGIAAKADDAPAGSSDSSDSTASRCALAVPTGFPGSSRSRQPIRYPTRRQEH